MAIETVRINTEGKERLSRLKKYTGLQNWNSLCRWALCKSLSDPSCPSPIDKKGEIGIEMTWKVFGGSYQEVYLALIRQRCKRDALPINDHNLSEQFWLHLHRGLGYLASDKSLRSAYGEGRRSARGFLELTNEE